MMEQKEKSRYSLRYAAGQYWLLDLKQTGMPYKQPMLLNEVGAQMWELLRQGMTVTQVSEVLSKEYDIDTNEIHEDVLAFLEQLKKQDIKVGE